MSNGLDFFKGITNSISNQFSKDQEELDAAKEAANECVNVLHKHHGESLSRAITAAALVLESLLDEAEKAELS